MILFLDDDEQRQELFRKLVPQAVIAATAQEAIAALQSATFQVIFLDHDLGGQVYVPSSSPETGMEVVRFLCSKLTEDFGDPDVIVHTMNFPAGQAMMAALEARNFRATRSVFGSNPFLALARQLGKKDA